MADLFRRTKTVTSTPYTGEGGGEDGSTPESEMTRDTTGLFYWMDMADTKQYPYILLNGYPAYFPDTDPVIVITQLPDRRSVGPKYPSDAATIAQGYTSEAGGTGPAGATGATGPTGPPGSGGRGRRLYYVETDSLVAGYVPSSQATNTDTFTFNNATPATIVRSTGSFVDDGWYEHQKATITNTTNNNITVEIRSVSATTLTLASTSALVQEDNSITATLTINIQEITPVFPTDPEVTTTIAGITSADTNGVVIASYYIVDAHPNYIPPGMWKFRGIFSATSETCTAAYEVVAKSDTGLETTYLFSTDPSSGLSSSPLAYVVFYENVSDILIDATDYLIVNVLGYNSSETPADITWTYQGEITPPYIDTDPYIPRG